MAQGKPFVLAVRLNGTVIHAIRQLLRFGDQRAAERDIEFLHTAADGKQGDALLNSSQNERDS